LLNQEQTSLCLHNKDKQETVKISIQTPKSKTFFQTRTGTKSQFLFVVDKTMNILFTQ
jgi:hypothetical protein